MPRLAFIPLTLAILMGLLGCGDRENAAHSTVTSPLSHEAYLWQGAWTGAVKESVASAPKALTGLRVLLLERRTDGEHVWPDVDTASLVASAKEVTAVVRIGGSRPIADFSLLGVMNRIEGWRGAGVKVQGIEIDHDCATARLASYTEWIKSIRPSLNGLRLSITALPTWMESLELRQLSESVDEIVLQVHAILAPRIFEPSQAIQWVDSFSKDYGRRPFRVALPTYRVVIDGNIVGADALEMQEFLSRLSESEVIGLQGIVWFRLPVLGDTMAFSAATLAALMEGRELVSEVTASLRPVGAKLYDIVVENRGTLPGRLPAVSLEGQVDAQDLSTSYHLQQGIWRSSAPSPLLPGETKTVGWVRGKDVNVEIR